MKRNFFRTANNVIEQLEEAGFEAYIVGGAVRDYLLNRDIQDIDITTSARCETLKEIFSYTVDVGIKHGTVIVSYENETFEVTEYRSKTLNEDLKLRDFTINAMALSRTGEIIDPYSGNADLKAGLIRGVENPTERFKEDPLRMLRAIRFVSQLNFTIEESTLQAIKSSRALIAKVAIERIVLEFEKLCLGAYAKQALQHLRSTSLSEEIPNFYEIHSLLGKQSVINSIQMLTNMTEIWSLLLYLSKEPNDHHYLRQWKQPKKIINEVDAIISRLPLLLERGFTMEALYLLGLETCQKAERVRATLKGEKANLDSVILQYSSLPIKKRNQLAINGTDVKLLLKDERPHERIGQIMSIVERAVYTQEIENKKTVIINWLLKEGHVNA